MERYNGHWDNQCPIANIGCHESKQKAFIWAYLFMYDLHKLVHVRYPLGNWKLLMVSHRKVQCSVLNHQSQTVHLRWSFEMPTGSFKISLELSTNKCNINVPVSVHMYGNISDIAIYSFLSYLNDSIIIVVCIEGFCVGLVIITRYL